MARVWAARVRGSSDVVALKMLLPNLAENVEFRKMFLDEARIASRVRHPNVCSTLRMGEQSGVLFLAMEWLDGTSLVRLLRPGPEDSTAGERVPIRPRIAARIIADACAGLHAAHELLGEDGLPLGVVHRDVSPHNLLITSDGSVKITDFGVAKALGKSHMTVAGQLKGKLAYMAPEQLVGGTVDRRSDVFSLGCVLYEITTGQRPFQGDHDPQLMAAIVMGRYEPPAKLVPHYPRELSIIVMRALANDAAHRYPSAEHMRRAIETYLRNSGPAVGPAQIAALLRERCGDDLVVRSDALRQLAAAPHEALPSSGHAVAVHSDSASDSSGAMTVRERASSSPRAFLWMLLAALLGATLGLFVLSYVRTMRRAKATQTTASSAPASSLIPFQTSKPMATAQARAQARSPVHLRIRPESAIVLLDGIVLPRGADTLARPDDGASVTVLVRADKHEDAVFTIDSSSPENVAITLMPKAAGSAPTRPRPHVVEAGVLVPEPPPIEAPPNPYD